MNSFHSLPGPSRRAFLKTGAGAAVAAGVPSA
ncbi:MAG: twin-arginine translocation signal domain-containing protein [Terriglobales bacterium]